MGKHQFVIDNQVVDVFGEEDVITAISYMISDVVNLESRSNPTSKTIKLPGTLKNKRIFGYADDLNSIDFKGQKVSLVGTIREDGTDILTGLVNLKSVTRTGSAVVFEVTVIGNCGEWVDLMRDADLPGIAIGGDHLKTSAVMSPEVTTDQVYAYGLVSNGWMGGQMKVATIEDDGMGRCKCIFEGTNEIYNLRTNFYDDTFLNGSLFSIPSYNIKHQVQSILADSVILKTSFKGDSSGILRSTKANVCVENRPLLINVGVVLRKLFDLAGYQITSSFIDSSFFRRLYLLPGVEKRSESWTTGYETRVGFLGDWYQNLITNTTQVIVPFYTAIKNDAGLWNTSTYRFTAVEAMHVNFRSAINIKGTEGRVIHMEFWKNGSAYSMGGANREIVSATLEEANYQVLEQEAEFRLMAGDYVEVHLYIYASGLDPSHFTISADNTVIECIPTDKIINGSSISPTEFLPAIKHIDFIQALRHAFNLYFFTDMAMKNVYIEPRNTFYKTDKYIDLTDKLDTSKPILYEELGTDLTKDIAFAYKKDDNDIGVTEWERLNGTRFSTYVASILNKFAKEGETVIENPVFAPTLMAPSQIGITSMLPKLWGSPVEGDAFPETLTEYAPRLLYYAGARDCVSGESWSFNRTATTWFPLFCSKDYETVNDNSLLFEQEALDLDLYTKHYQNHILTLNASRKITAFFKLTASDLQALSAPDPTGGTVKDFRSQVFFRIGGEVTNCRLDSIVDYRPGGGQSTKVVLITDTDNIFTSLLVPGIKLEFLNNTLVLPAVNANGCIYKISTNWSTARNSAIGQAMICTTAHGIGSTGKGTTVAPYTVERLFLYFDTSSIPDSATIQSAFIEIHKLSGDSSQEATLFQGTQASPLMPANFQSFGSVALGETTPGPLGTRRIYMNAAGIALINKTGITKYCLRESHFDVQNIAPAANYATFRTHITTAPIPYINKLVVKYTV